ncbi:hypothetical protein GE061_016252 [Apolygus lucorum]|uniref:Uncharacterized protein n=1 Tax=Apolygus lucorum TaxID=248454 RepID=A0A8S9XFQ6_APOLU|nr:hypothetical protein GE061_016252 [Apolygus lucorum]
MRIPPQAFDKLLQLVSPLIQRQDTMMRDAITPKVMLEGVGRPLLDEQPLPAGPLEGARRGGPFSLQPSALVLSATVTKFRELWCLQCRLSHFALLQTCWITLCQPQPSTDVTFHF